MLAIVAAALAVRVALFLVALPHPRRFFTLDSGAYMALARDPGAGYLDPRAPLFVAGLMRTPVYPLWTSALLAVSGGAVELVVLSQTLVGLATVGLVHRLARRLFGRGPALASALVLALDPVSAIYVNLLQPEALFTLLIVATAVCWLAAIRDGSARSAAAAGSLLGLAALTRPIAVYLPLLLVPVGWALRRGAAGRARVSLPLLLAFMLVVGGWIGRNALVTGVPLVSTIEGTNLLYYRAAGAVAEEQGLSMEDARTRLRERLRERIEPGADPARESRAETALAFEVMREHPRGTLKAAAKGALRLLAGTGLTALSNLCGDPDPEGLDDPAKLAGAALLGLALVAIYSGALRGVWLLAQRESYRELGFLLTFILYFVVVSAGPEANTRFRFPTMPFWAVLAGCGYTGAGKARAADGPPSP